VVAEPLLGVGGRAAPEARSGKDARTVTVHDEHRRPVGGSANDDRVVPGELAGDREVRRRERVVQETGERRLGDHRELRAGGQRSAD
jgi:hypothetical protein